MPSALARTPVPSSTTDRIISVTTYATSGRTTWVGSTVRASLPSTESTKRGGAYLPPAAKVATALVISSGVTTPEPSDSDSSLGSSLCTPILCANAATAAGVTSAATRIATVLI